MRSGIDGVIRSAMRQKDDSVNIIYFPYNGFFEQMLGECKHRFFTCTTNAVSEWKSHFPLPQNFVSIPDSISKIPSYVDIDLVVCNNKNTQIKAASMVSDNLHLPLLIIDHEPPSDNAKDIILRQIENTLPDATRIVTSDKVINERWQVKDSIEVPYYFPIEHQDQDRTEELVIAGDFILGDYYLLQQFLDMYHSVKIYGDNQGLPENIDYVDVNELTHKLLNTQVFLSVNPPGQPPLHMLHAMSCGCAVVANKTSWTESIITDGDNGILVDFDDVKSALKSIMGKKDKIRELGKKAQETIQDKYNAADHVDRWNQILFDAAEKIYKR